MSDSEISLLTTSLFTAGIAQTAITGPIAQRTHNVRNRQGQLLMRVPYPVLPGTRLPTSRQTGMQALLRIPWREHPALLPPIIPLHWQNTINRMLGLSSNSDPELESQIQPRQMQINSEKKGEMDHEAAADDANKRST